MDGLRPDHWDPVEEDEGIDHFDRLPDSVLLVIFNLVGDVKALGRCCVVSRRFHALVRLVDEVVVRVDCVISDDPSLSRVAEAGGAAASDKPRGVFSHLARIVLGGLVKPLVALGQILSPSSSSSAAAAAAFTAARKSAPSSSSFSSTSSDVSHHSPTEVLKNFNVIRRLRIELPDGELGVDDGVLLKWRADFGSTLDSCVILSASSVAFSSSISPDSPNPNPSLSFEDACVGDDCGSMPDSFYTDGSLKRRVVWTISSLIAASARHYLLHPIVADHETLESLHLTDADGQGVLTMDRRQLQELRGKPVMASGCSQRTLLPALSMRLWYAQQLELPDGMLLKGATLLAIKPSEEWTTGAAGGSVGLSDGCRVSDAFEEPYRTAAKMLMNRRTYCLEMNSF
ncbi:F-box protein At5g46170 [Musa acuminata AAA Group]|uniref:F-box protein At5g46170 n=1 Tax=Musa acuminata AAA Group TaxID=214697 RepID=UPI0031DF1F88